MKLEQPSVQDVQHSVRHVQKHLLIVCLADWMAISFNKALLVYVRMDTLELLTLMALLHASLVLRIALGVLSELITVLNARLSELEDQIIDVSVNQATLNTMENVLILFAQPFPTAKLVSLISKMGFLFVEPALITEYHLQITQHVFAKMDILKKLENANLAEKAVKNVTQQLTVQTVLIRHITTMMVLVLALKAISS